MRFESLIPGLLLTTCSLALACSDDGNSEVGDEVETSGDGDGDGDSESNGESTDADTSTDDVDTSTDDVDTSTDDVDTTTTFGTTEAETTDAETETETADETTDTGPLGCGDIEAEYESLVTMTACQGDEQCKIIQGHCGVGLGGCDYAVNLGVSEAELDQLAQAYTNANCTNGVCDCAPPPMSAVCMDGTCVGVD